MIDALIAAGMDCARLNFSHGTHEEHAARIRLVREGSLKAGRPVAVMADLQGPKLRVAKGFEATEIVNGQEVLIYGVGQEPPVGLSIPIDPPVLAEVIEAGHVILLNDGAIRLRALSGFADGPPRALVEVGGLVKPRQGVALPGVEVPIPSLTRKDLSDLDFVLAADVDYVALSFVRSAEDVYGLKMQIASLGYDTPVVAKVEQAEALLDLDMICEAADVVMVARGDLGVEVGPEGVPLEQKRIIRCSLDHAKPVITATQMLESMVHSPSPTRAEASDVANAVLDGSSAIMLSGETAKGDYPLEAVRTMDRIARHVEIEVGHRPSRHPLDDPEQTRTRSVLTSAAADIAEHLDAAAIVIPTTSGATAAAVARHRPQRTMVGLSHNERTLRRMALYWGVVPVPFRQCQQIEEMLDEAMRVLRDRRLAERGQRVVVTAGSAMNVAGSTDLIKVVEV